MPARTERVNGFETTAVRNECRADVLAREFAGQAKTIEDVNELMRLMMKSALERMLDTEMDVHLGRRPSGESVGAVGGNHDGSDRVAHGRDRAVQEGAEPSQRSIEEDGPHA
jgi:hypothetical protein